MAHKMRRDSDPTPEDEDREPLVDPSDSCRMNALNSLHGDLKDFRKEFNDGQKVLNDRLRRVEIKIAMILGGVGVMAFLLTVLGFWTRPLIEAIVQQIFAGQ